jgi:2-oxoglutarate dehydrogenase complex dehydrogenase (E1) component-like enzyme
VWECFGLSGVKGYDTGGCIHFIINNQIGFTTSPQFSRGSPYPSDVAKGVQAPIIHVNGDDPEAVTFACKLGMDYRQTFGRDIVIDMWCYRRFGHNEGDEPSFTQPLMYAKIRQHQPVSEIYAARLQQEGVIDAASWVSRFRPSTPIWKSISRPPRPTSRMRRTGSAAAGRASPSLPTPKARAATCPPASRPSCSTAWAAR